MAAATSNIYREYQSIWYIIKTNCASKKHNHPIYTLQTLTKRTYVVGSPELVIAVQKDTKNLSFNPFVVAFTPRMFNVSKRDMEIVNLNYDSKDGDWVRIITALNVALDPLLSACLVSPKRRMPGLYIYHIA